ncbi:MAG: hypothetical protein Q4C05_02935 [Akkermansia sp.]|nr:hypothetical protein [Akkermansia sp.]
MSASLNLNDQELMDLAEMVVLAATVSGSNNDESYAPQLYRWGDLAVKIMGLAASQPKLKKNFQFAEEANSYIFTDKYDLKAAYRHCLDEHRDSFFWQDLVTRLSDKILSESIDDETLEEMSEQERRQIMEPLEAALWEEVSLYGIDRLEIVLPIENND